MDLPWGDPRSTQFITNVGLITSDGPNGPDIMSSEWTHHISYSPGLLAVCIRPGGATHENIRSSKEFGVSIAATDQNVMASVAGTNKGKEVDKIAALQELGFKFRPAKQINALMVEGAVLNIECRLKQELALGSHTVFVGEAVEATLNPGKKPLAYHAGQFWRLTEAIAKPGPTELERIAKTVAAHQRK
ncbi:MAG TPA: flavin reductase family protein [Candidatus Diapherotrites archaeon]|uniref:Flavin reductase n=1 Tax=Candidatus Iainarchaeum sp. TaxID=3101447 RepID=A0A7J4JHU6_9ARCH|nr:flavin reductase [Candidatus Diapherotrites archaeon]HIH16169.1 flavin reductase family protein [Candidatus Diapherotrites archaeon]